MTMTPILICLALVALIAGFVYLPMGGYNRRREAIAYGLLKTAALLAILALVTNTIEKGFKCTTPTSTSR